MAAGITEKDDCPDDIIRRPGNPLASLPGHFEMARSELVTITTANEIELYASNRLDSSAAIDVFYTGAGGGASAQAGLTDSTWRIYAVISGVRVLILQSTRSLRDPTTNQRILHARARIAERFIVTVQARGARLDGLKVYPTIELSVAITGHEATPAEDAEQTTRFVAINTTLPVLIQPGAGGIVQLYGFLSAGGADYLMLFDSLGYPEVPPADGRTDWLTSIPVSAASAGSLPPVFSEWMVRAKLFTNGLYLSASTTPDTLTNDVGAPQVNATAELLVG